MRIWITPEEAVPHTPFKSRKVIYEQIRTGIFPFKYRRAGRTILIDARDLGLLDLPIEPQPEPQPETQSASAAAK